MTADDRAAFLAHELHVQINSRMDQWMQAVREQARTEGHSSGVRDERERKETK